MKQIISLSETIIYLHSNFITCLNVGTSAKMLSNKNTFSLP